MTDRVKRKTGRWVVAGVLGALLMPLALAQPPHGGHGFDGGGHGFGLPFGISAPRARRTSSTWFTYAEPSAH